MNKYFPFLLLIFCLSCLSLSAQVEWKKEPLEVSQKEVFPKWSFGVNGGYGYRLFRSGRRINASNRSYIKNLKSGIAFGGEVSYFHWKRVGFGLKYERYQSKAEDDNNLSEDVTVQHLSGSLIHRTFLKNNRSAILTSFLVGYQPYQNKTVAGSEQFTFTGKTMGWGFSVGIEHRLSTKFALNLTGSAMMGAVYRLKRETEFNTEMLHLSKDNSVDLSRVSLTLGVRFLR
jgi:hypothetical protein